jgi:beta-N-acetylhexosaminidase
LARQRHPSAVVVDMGWPSQGREYADVATFGASRFVGRALAVWLDRAASAASDPLVQKAVEQ